MTPGDWIALAALIIPSLAAIGGWIWWLARRDTQAEESIKAVYGLKVAVEAQTEATNKATNAINKLEAKLESLEKEQADHRQQVDREHQVLHGRIDKIQDRLDQGGACNG